MHIIKILYYTRWSGTAYIAYIKKLGHNSNKPVGNIEAVSGLASLICALPIGYLADTIGRSIVIRSGGILLFVTAILQISILQYTAGIDIDTDNPNDDHKDTIALWVSLRLFFLCMCCVLTVSESISRLRSLVMFLFLVTSLEWNDME
jgi:MFS family permease